jgi:hypothetical protein
MWKALTFVKIRGVTSLRIAMGASASLPALDEDVIYLASTELTV